MTEPRSVRSGIFPEAPPYPTSCSQNNPEKKKKEKYSSAIAVGSVFLGSLLTLAFHNKSLPITRLLFGTKFAPQPRPTKFLDRLMAPLDKPFHYAGQVGLPIAVIEFGLRWAAGYDYNFSAAGGICSMFFWNRIGIQYWGLDRAGVSLMFLLDRGFDAMTQVQSGENWRTINWYNLANHYGMVSLFGNFRARLVRDFLYRKAQQRLIKTVALHSGTASSRLLIYERGAISRLASRLERWRKGPEAVRAISGEEDRLVSTLFKSANWNNRVWVNEQGQLVAKGGRLLGSELSELQRQGIARLLGRERFETLFNGAGGFRIDQLGAAKCLQLKVKGDATFLGFLAYWTIQEPIMAPLVVAIPASLFCGEDFGKSAQNAFYKGFLMFPRQYFKLHLGIDTGWASFVDRILKYTMEPYFTKFIPLFASKGLWRKHYDQAICSGSLEEFVDYHIAPRVWEGGLFRYNENINIQDPDTIPRTLLPLPKRTDFSGPSPYSPIGVSFKLLAEYYAKPDSMDEEERKVISYKIEQIIAEAESRRHLDRQSFLQYQDDTVLQLAKALSTAVYYAHRKNSEYFADLMKRHEDWFRQFETVSADPQTVERFVDSL